MKRSILLALSFLSLPTLATAQTWNGAGATANWTDAANWGGTLPANDGTAELLFAGTQRTTTLLAQNWTISRLTFTGSGFSVGGTNALTVGSGGIVLSSPTTYGAISTLIDCSQVALSTSQTWDIRYASTLTVNSTITGTANLTKDGSGTLVLGSANNSFLGTVTVGGTLAIAGNGSLGSVSNALAFNGGTLRLGTGTGTGYTPTPGGINRPITLGSSRGNGGTFDTNGFNETLNGNLGGSGGFDGSFGKSGKGTLTLTAANTFNGLANITDGTLRLANSLALQNANVSVSNAYQATGVLSFGTLTTATFGDISGSSNFSLTNSSGQAVALTVKGNSSPYLSGAITGMGSITKNGTGTYTFAGAHTYTGDTVVNAGKIKIIDTYSLPNSTVVLNVNDGLTFGTGTFTSVGGLAGNGNVAVAYTDNGAQNSTWLYVGANNKNTTYSGAFGGIIDAYGNPSSGTVQKTGSGTWTLTGGTAATPSFLSAFYVDSGAVVLNGGNLKLSTSYTATNYSQSGGTFTVQNGGVVQSKASILSGGSFNVSGAGSVFNSSDFRVGEYSKPFAELNVINGGLLSTYNATLGRGPSTYGKVSVSGAGSRWTTQFLNVGDYGTGELVVLGGGYVASNGGVSVGATSKNGVVTLSGVGSLLQSDGLYIGSYSTGSGEVTLADNATINTGSRVTEIRSGTSRIIANNGTLITAGLSDYYGSGADNGLRIDGGGFQLQQSGNSTFRKNIVGTGEFVKAGDGTLTLTATQSSWSGDGYIILGGGLTATGDNGATTNPVTSAIGNPQTDFRSLAVQNNSTFTFGSSHVLGNVGSVPKLTLVADTGGTITAAVATTNVLGPLLLRGGTLTNNGGASAASEAYVLTGTVSALGVAPSTMSGVGNYSGYHLRGDITFNVADATGNADADLTVTTPLRDFPGGVGSLTKTGAGTLVLLGNNTYTGTTTINAGKLVTNGTGMGSLVVGGGAIWGGSGGTGAVSVGDGGIVSPGNSIGILNASSLTAASGAIFDIELGAGGLSDSVALNGAFDFAANGNYTVRFFDGTMGTTLTGSQVVGTTYRLARFGTSNAATALPKFQAIAGANVGAVDGAFVFGTDASGGYLDFQSAVFATIPESGAGILLPVGGAMLLMSGGRRLRWRLGKR